MPNELSLPEPLVGKKALIPLIPCVACGVLLHPNQMQFNVERGHAIHRCRDCAKRLGLDADLEYCKQSIAEETALFEEMIVQSDPMQFMHFVKERFGGGVLGIKQAADFAVTQGFITAAVRPGSRTVLEYIKFFFNGMVEAAKDRRAEIALNQQSDAEIEKSILALASKAIIVNAVSRVSQNANPSPPALAAEPAVGPLPADAGGTGPTAEAGAGAGTEAVREPQPVGTAA